MATAQPRQTGRLTHTRSGLATAYKPSNRMERREQGRRGNEEG
nr:MAG TPA: hypothetical protein [Caudoviricetes sp.]